MPEDSSDFLDFLKKAGNYFSGNQPEEQKPDPGMNYGETPAPVDPSMMSQIEKTGVGEPQGLEPSIRKAGPNPEEPGLFRVPESPEGIDRMQTMQDFNKFTGDDRKPPAQPIDDGGLSDAMVAYAQKASPPAMPPPEPQMGMPAPAAGPQRPDLGAMLASLKGTQPEMAPLQSSLGDLEKAQAERKKNLSDSKIMRGAESIASALSHGKADYGYADLLNKEADIPIENYKAKEASKVSDLKLREAQQQMNDEKFRKDPNSTLNQMMRGVFTKMGMPVPQNATIDGMKELVPAIDTYFRAELAKQAKATAAETKKTSDQDKDYTKMRHDLETFRGNRPVQQAALDVYSAQKALGLVKNKNPDELTTQDLRLLNSEIAKIATGGVPGEHGVTALMPNNLQTKAAELQNFLTSNPTDAQAGEYIRKNLKYLQQMTDEGDKVVREFRKNIMHGFKNRVKPEDMQETLNDYHMNEGAPQAQASAFPRQVRKGGQVATVKNAKELKEASDEGWQ